MPQPSPSTDTWTEERVETLKKLWAEGRTASQCASLLGRDVTRNAVISKVHRLKLAKRDYVPPPKPKRNGNAGKPKANAIVHRVLTRPRPSVEEAIDPGVDVTHLLGIMKLNQHTCRWPMSGQGAKTLFCGKHTKDGSVYCADHHRRAHQARVVA